MVRGFNQYESLYADAKLWLNEGWCDYFTPQLYWKITATSQPYPNLLDWWIGENLRGRHIWPATSPAASATAEPTGMPRKSSARSTSRATAPARPATYISA